MISNCTKHAMVVTRSMSRALISSTPASRQQQQQQQYQFNDLPNKKQFRLQLNHKYAYIKYKKDGELYNLLHSEVPKELRGKGIGKIIAEKTFEHIKANNLRMKLSCKFLVHVNTKFGDKYKNFVA